MRRRYLSLAAAAVLVLSLLSGCGGGAKSETSASYAHAEAPAAAPMEAAADMVMTEESAVYSVQSAGGGAAKQDGLKRIYTAHLELETTAFDEAAKGLTDLMEGCGGWFESSSMGNRGSGYRYASYTVRVPAERYRDFVEQAGELCLVTYCEEYVEDVSEHYYDTQGRLKTQQIKLERLQALLEKAEAMEDIITIESAISETEQYIDDLSGTLQHYDARVDYSTVYISLREVAQLSNVEQPAIGFGAQLGAALSGGWKNFVSGMQGLTIALAYGWIWVLILIAAAVVAVKAVRGKLRLPRPRKKKKEEDGQE